MKSYSSDFFIRKILNVHSSHSELFDSFEPAVAEVTVSGNTFYKIDKDSDHYRYNKKITSAVLSKIPVNSAACAFVNKKSYFDFLSSHVVNRNFIRIDIKKFFHSLSEKDVVLLISNSLDIDCEEYLDFLLNIVMYRVSDEKKRFLPIGFPSSPVISNLLFRKIDLLIQEYCFAKNIAYTRYADDMLFSSNSLLIHSDEFMKEIRILVGLLGLQVNDKKTIKRKRLLSINGYIVDCTKDSYRSKSGGGYIRFSTEKLAGLKKALYKISIGESSQSILSSVFGFDCNKKLKGKIYSSNFIGRYCDDQLRNKLRGYRSFLLSLANYSPSLGVVHGNEKNKYFRLVEKIDSYLDK